MQEAMTVAAFGLRIPKLISVIPSIVTFLRLVFLIAIDGNKQYDQGVWE